MKKFYENKHTKDFPRGLKGLLFAGCVFFLAVFPAAAQSEVAAVLEYCDYPDQIQITDGDGFVVREAYFGMDLGTGDTIKTEGTAAEIRLTRSGSLIRLAPNTHFRIDRLAGSRGEQNNAFSLEEGKMRGVAAGGTEGRFTVHTPSALCAAAGADFAVSSITGFFDGAAVKAGSVSLSKNATNETITIPKGNAADAGSGNFRPEEYPARKIEEIFYDLEFVMLDPDIFAEAAQAAPADSMPLAAAESVPGQNTPEPRPAYGSSEWLAGLADRHFSLSAELGALTVDRTTYSLFVVKPTLSIDRFSMGLYLPLIFSGNIMSPSEELHPRGNDEWDFGKGVNQSHYSDAGRKDFLRDLMLKIHFIEYAKPGDFFFVKAGSFREMTLGHGSLMYKYANDADFPALRRVGLHMGMDAGIAGFELVGADMAEADIFGGRVFVRPFSSLPFSLGLSAVTDKHPMYALPDSVITAYPAGESPRDADLLMNGFAADIDFVLWKKDASSLSLFADAATLIPSLRNRYALSNLEGTQGFLENAFYDESYAGKIRNYGVSAGTFGSLNSFDYRLEFRQYKGLFRPGLIGGNYDRLRGFYAAELLNYIGSPDDSRYTAAAIAFYAEAGVRILDKLRLSAGYLMPSEKDGTTLDDDYLEFRLKMEKGLIPLPFFNKLSFSFDYVQNFFAPIFRDLVKGRQTEFVNGYTLLKGEAAYTVNDNVDIALFLSTAAERDTDGHLAYNADFEPEWIYVFGLQARIKM